MKFHKGDYVEVKHPEGWFKGTVFYAEPLPLTQHESILGPGCTIGVRWDRDCRPADIEKTYFTAWDYQTSVRLVGGVQ